MFELPPSLVAVLTGFISGLFLSIPVGPVNLSIINEGARRGFQWAILISLGGGVLGILVGVSIPLSVQFFQKNLRIPISATSIIVAFVVSCVVGLVFGMLPANRASRLDPTEALRYE